MVRRCTICGRRLTKKGCVIGPVCLKKRFKNVQNTRVSKQVFLNYLSKHCIFKNGQKETSRSD